MKAGQIANFDQKTLIQKIEACFFVFMLKQLAQLGY